jgi:ABC-type nickel/cobalt efflux system permease component RcnA
MSRYPLIRPVQIVGCVLTVVVGTIASGYSYISENYAEVLAFMLATVIAPSVIWLLGSIARSLHRQAHLIHREREPHEAVTEPLDEDTLQRSHRHIGDTENVYSAPNNRV